MEKWLKSIFWPPPCPLGNELFNKKSLATGRLFHHRK
jgi:hypothetical protein